MSSGRITPDDVLGACDAAGAAREPVTAGEIADHLGCRRDTARNRLEELADRGELRSKAVGEGERVWWRPTTESRSLGEIEEMLTDEAKHDHLTTELRDVFSRISDGFYALDTEWRFTYVNERAEALIDYRGEGLVGENIWEVFEWAADSKLGEEYHAAMERQEPTVFEFYYPEPLDAWYEINAYPSETGLSVYFRDISERKAQTRALQEREEQLSRLMENVPGMVYRCWNERGWPVEFVSDACRDLTGYAPDALERGDVAWGEDVIVDADREAVWEGIQTAVTDREPFSITYRIETVDGERRWVRSHGRGIFDDDGELVVLEGIISDITTQKERERELEEHRSWYRTLVENFPNGAVALVDRDLRYVTFGGTPEGDSGVTRTELEGELLRDALPSELADVVVPHYRAALDGEISTFEESVGEETYQFHFHPVRDDDGDIFAALGLSQDITDRRAYQRQLEQSNERLESFASMLAHELRNPVAVGQIYGQQLSSKSDSDAVEYVIEAFDRIEDMINIMLVLTRGEEAVSDPTALQLVPVARDVWEEIDTTSGTLETDGDYTVAADETYLRHLLRNLFDNALQHGGRDITVTVGELPTGFYVEDDGTGIPPDERDTVFEAGYTTAADGGGSGLGLAFVSELATAYGWEVTVNESEAGGARFEFRDIDQEQRT
ncbi:PAS domain S-box protein [Haloarcula amylovorans]|uniref:PAS domain S-box protein n=1 Tax=Haloarcula amylovorans TaxID=2562280 RepID=UPI001075D9B7|nr:PAS domain S-box protein [Halomicroarcula amylolytica]